MLSNKNKTTEILGKHIRRSSLEDAPTSDDLKNICKSLNNSYPESAIYIDLRDGLPDHMKNNVEESGILICQNIVDKIWGNGETSKFEEEFHEVSKRANKYEYSMMHKKVINLKIRHHIYIGNTKKEADYENDQGCVESFEEMPYAKKWKNWVEKTFHDHKVNCPDLTSCTNVNYDKAKTGIGWHGDGERTIIVTLRLHDSSPHHKLKFHWMLNGQPIGQPISFTLYSGDAYFMSKKATGNDWLNKKTLTLRHAAGGELCKPSTVDYLYKKCEKRTKKRSRE